MNLSTAVTTPSTTRALLERYVEAKDLMRPQLMREIYTREAILTYSIATDTIHFPARVAGVEGITQTLVVDFAARFGSCRTYYVTEGAPDNSAHKLAVPWLVVMQEKANAKLRIGRGCYEWHFAEEAGDKRVCAMSIHIDRMDALVDDTALLRNAIQGRLPYPWLQPAILRERFEALARTASHFNFLADFSTPFHFDE
jgi:hypothetical protein